MNLSVRTCWLPKGGNSVDEYEDAFDCSILGRRFAIADGATESSFAAPWAKSLVSGFIETPPFDSSQPGTRMKDWIEPLQKLWREGIDWQALPWYSEEKARAGAFSSLLGFEIETHDDSRESSPGLTSRDVLRWRALAVGDSCLFHVSGDALVASFPLRKANEFGNRPLLLSSNPQNNEAVWTEVRYHDGACHPADMFILATDALAHWFLRCYESGSKPWKDLFSLNTEGDFAAFVAHSRENHLMSNDDTTLLLVSIDNGVVEIRESADQKEMRPIEDCKEAI